MAFKPFTAKGPDLERLRKANIDMIQKMETIKPAETVQQSRYNRDYGTTGNEQNHSYLS